MEPDPLYLTKNEHCVYYYRRPIVADDQQFWRGPSGNRKKEWVRSLRTKDRRTAIERMTDAADMFEAEREAQLAAYAAQMPVDEPEGSEREQEEREAIEAARAGQSARRAARRDLRVERRLRLKMSTVELSPEEAAWHDLVSERDVELEQLRAAVHGQRTATAELAEELGKPVPSAPAARSIGSLIAAYEADKSPGWSGSSKKAVAPVFRLLRDVFPERELASITRDEARGVVKLLQELPAHIGKKKELRGLSVPEAVEMGRRLSNNHTGIRAYTPNQTT